MQLQIAFGTDGWRGIIAEDFTFANVRLVVQGIADFLLWPERSKLGIYMDKPGASYSCTFRPADSGVVIGYDTRFLSPQFAREASEIFSANGIPVHLASEPASISSISIAVREFRAAGAVYVTASHNPPEYNGIKFRTECGSSMLPEGTRALEERIARMQKGKRQIAKDLRAHIREFSPRDDHIKKVSKLVDMERIASARFKVVSDPIYGANRGYIVDLLSTVGGCVEEIRGEMNPSFGGYNPEPIGKNLAPLVEKVLRCKADIGFAFDGDGDRFGVVDSRGRFLNAHEIFALLLQHLVENRHWSGGVVKTFSTSQMVDLLAEKYGFAIYETPIGFKYICQLMLEHDVLIGGEESGGIGVKNHIPERDAILNCLLLLEMMAYSGKCSGSILEDLVKEVGFFSCHRLDLHMDDVEKTNQVLEKLLHSPPASINGLKVLDVRSLDGVKYLLPDRGWILFRSSGTEPVLRIYVEARSHEVARRLLEQGEEMVISA